MVSFGSQTVLLWHFYAVNECKPKCITKKCYGNINFNYCGYHILRYQFGKNVLVKRLSEIRYVLPDENMWKSRQIIHLSILSIEFFSTYIKTQTKNFIFESFKRIVRQLPIGHIKTKQKIHWVEHEINDPKLEFPI